MCFPNKLSATNFTASLLAVSFQCLLKNKIKIDHYWGHLTGSECFWSSVSFIYKQTKIPFRKKIWINDLRFFAALNTELIYMWKILKEITTMLKTREWWHGSEITVSYCMGWISSETPVKDEVRVKATESCPTPATPWTVACQAPLSMGFSRQEYWSGLPFTGSWNQDLEELSASCAHRSAIYNSQEVEATYVSVSGWMDKEDATHTHTHRMERYSAIRRRKSFYLWQHGWPGEHYGTWSVRQRKANNR